MCLNMNTGRERKNIFPLNIIKLSAGALGLRVARFFCLYVSAWYKF